MKYYVMTLFPEMIMQVMSGSITGRAIDSGHISVEAVNIRDYTNDKHGSVDDYPYGGGAGMVMQAQPIYDCYRSIKGRAKPGARVIYLTPQGRTFDQRMAEELSGEEELIFLCGHYEGIDERVIEEIVTDEVSIGDYVLTGGELPAMVLMDAISRLVPGVLHNADSAGSESFTDGLLEYPQYSRPETWQERTVPAILLSGDHAKVDAWRLEQAKERTRNKRPDLWEKYENSLK